MRPVNIDSLQAEIDRFEAERCDVKDEIDQLDTPENRLSDVERQRTDLDDRIADKREALEDAEADLEFTEYLYRPLSVTYPVLSDITDLTDTLRTARDTVDETLASREDSRLRSSPFPLDKCRYTTQPDKLASGDES